MPRLQTILNPFRAFFRVRGGVRKRPTIQGGQRRPLLSSVVCGNGVLSVCAETENEVAQNNRSENADTCAIRQAIWDLEYFKMASR